MSQNDSAPINLRVQWTLNPSSIPLPANNLMILEGVSVGNGTASTFELFLGHVSPPPVFAESPEQARQMIADSPAFINPVGHFSVTIDVLRQIQETVTEAISKYESSRD